MITLENINVRSRLQGISVSVCGSGSLAGHEYCTLLNTSYSVGVPAVTDQPVEWAVPAPLESALVQSQPESQAGDLCTGGSHMQDPITCPVLGISASSWNYCRVNIFQMIEMCLEVMDLAKGNDKVDRSFFCPF